MAGTGKGCADEGVGVSFAVIARATTKVARSSRSSTGCLMVQCSSIPM